MNYPYHPKIDNCHLTLLRTLESNPAFVQDDLEWKTFSLVVGTEWSPPEDLNPTATKYYVLRSACYLRRGP